MDKVDIAPDAQGARSCRDEQSGRLGRHGRGRVALVDGGQHTAGADDDVGGRAVINDDMFSRKVGWWRSCTTSRYYGIDRDGEPIYRDGRIYYCSECGYKSIIKHNYCPDCGKKMEGQHDN